MNLLENYYISHEEENRLHTRHGLVEFLTTMRYVVRYLPAPAHVLEVGAGTGRYSRALADMGHRVQAVELVQHNIDVFRGLVTPSQQISITQGNALDLHPFAADTFDATLVLGPMYHLYTPADKHQAISEALRVTKPGGVVFVAYCISDATILEDAFKNNLFMITDYMEKGQIDPTTFACTSLPQDIFELVRKDDIDQLMAPFWQQGAARRLHYVATDMLSRFLRESLAAMDPAAFDLYMRYHYAVCERPDLVGATHHSLDVFRKG